MAYFKINTSGCGERKGLVEVRYDCYLSRDDVGSEEHYVTVPDFTDAKYDGKVTDLGVPEDTDHYEKWVAALPTITRNNPFCCHFVQFEADVTDEIIVTTGDKVLEMALANYAQNALYNNCNEPLELLKATDKAEAESRVSSIKTTNYVAVAATLATTHKIRG